MQATFLTSLSSTICLLFIICHFEVRSSPVQRLNTMDALTAELQKNEMIQEVSLKITDIKPKNMVIKAGEAVELRCEAAGSPPPVFYWIKDGKKIQGSAHTNVYEKLRNLGKQTIQNAVTLSRHFIPCASAADAGQYKCIATNGIKEIEHSFSVAVEETSSTTVCPEDSKIPRIIQWHDARFENEFNAVQFTCRSSDPSAVYAWYNEDRKLLNNEENFEVLSNGDLMIKNASWDLMGTYTCVASNDFGEDRVDVFFYPTAIE